MTGTGIPGSDGLVYILFKRGGGGMWGDKETRRITTGKTWIVNWIPPNEENPKRMDIMRVQSVCFPACFLWWLKMTIDELQCWFRLPSVMDALFLIKWKRCPFLWIYGDSFFIFTTALKKDSDENGEREKLNPESIASRITSKTKDNTPRQGNLLIKK